MWTWRGECPICISICQSKAKVRLIWLSIFCFFLWNILKIDHFFQGFVLINETRGRTRGRTIFKFLIVSHIVPVFHLANGSRNKLQNVRNSWNICQIILKTMRELVYGYLLVLINFKRISEAISFFWRKYEQEACAFFLQKI